ncbi:MAG: OmpA family protein [Candidatus Lernaella stagnicola]|nr:OmpA family protein [Candidatus Lernaella stagnicola]
MKRAAVLALLVILAGATAVSAIDAQNVTPALGPHNLLSMYASTTLAHTQFALGIVGNYAKGPVRFEGEDSGTEINAVDSVISGHFYAGLGLFDHLDLLVGGSYYRTAGQDMDKVMIDGLPETDITSAGALGDTTAGAKVSILPNKPGWIGLGLVALAHVATGDEEIYAGNGATGFSGALLLDKRFDPVNIVANVGYEYLGSPSGLDPAGQVFGGLGIDVAAAKWIGLTAEVVGRTQDYGIEEIDPANPLEGLFGARFYTGVGLDFLTAFGFGLTNGIGAPEYRGMLGVSFTYPALDYGPKPALAPSPAGLRAADSADMDTDGDGLNNHEEIHEYKTNSMKSDSDGDGLLDGEEVKQYKTDPLKTDTDGDSLSDAAELRLHGTDPLRADTDGDGLLDGQEVSALRTNPVSADTDGDGVADGADGAPLEAETVNGFLDQDGVPEVLLVRKPSGLMLFDSQLVLPAPLTFAGPGSSKLTNADKKQLRDVAKLMSEFENIKLHVEGHVAAGTPNAESLSGSRATTVRTYLLKQGVAADRLTAAGMGDQVPLVSNDTPEGLARNTRIDFLITER